jgi:predicted ribosomally synthesized peptide with SipW-like signal peptide
MKRIFVSLSIIAAVAAIAIGGTIAYFSDTETSSGNTFTAGTLDLAVGGQNPNISPDFTIGNVAPGSSGTITYNLTNVGSLVGFLDLSGISVVDTEGLNPESETGNTDNPGELSANIYVTVTLGASILYAGLLSGIAEAYDADVAIAAGGATTLTINWVVDQNNIGPLGADVGNDIQGDIATVGLTIELDQVAD